MVAAGEAAGTAAVEKEAVATEAVDPVAEALVGAVLEVAVLGKD